jgi:alkaline phosphatase D
VWDDHEVADNTWRGSSSHLNNTESSFLGDGGVSVDQRKMNAVRAYFEWMPLRQVEMDDNLRIWRNFQIGTLFDLIMLDTRQYDRSITDLYWNTHYIHEIANDAGRTMMGSRQENWFYGSLIESQKRNAAWRVIGNQVVFSRINQSQSFGPIDPLNGDQWDGYQANRNRTLQTLYNNKIDNTIFLAGDSHMNWVSDLVWLDEKSYDPVTGAGSIGVEFASTAVSSSSPFGSNTNIANGQKRSQFLIETNEELQWQEGYYRGYIELELGYDRSNVTYFGMPTLKTRNSLEIALAQFEIKAGANKLTRNPTVGGGVAEAGALKGGKINQTNRTIDTSTGKVVPPLID